MHGAAALGLRATVSRADGEAGRRLIEQVGVIQRILRHLGVPTEIHEPRPARAPPLPFDARARHVAEEATAFDPC